MPNQRKRRDESAKPPGRRGRKPPEDTGEGNGPPDGGEERQVGPGNPDADPVRIHEAFVERRLGGGRAATPEAYEQAVRQFRRLPGAVRVPPTELTGEDAPPGTESGPRRDEGERPGEEPSS